MQKVINYKNNNTKVIDLDENNYVVKVGISTVNYKDSDNDIIVKEAFNKTLQEFSKRIVHLKNHIINDVIGRPQEFGWDGDLLYAVSKISNSTKGRDAIEDYRLDLYEHSIGFETLKSYEEDNATIITELKLWEYSSVTWGANDRTPFLGFLESKEFTKSQKLEEVNKKMKNLLNGIKKGNFTDERFRLLEFELKQLQDLYNSLIETEQPINNNHLTEDKPNEELRQLFEGFKF